MTRETAEPSARTPQRSRSSADPLPSDFYRLWGAVVANQFGNAFGAGALPLVAILLLDACELQVAAMAAGAGIVAAGLVVVLVAETLLLFCAGVFNPVFHTYRMNRTADDHMVRVGTAWSISSKSVQPAFIALGGAIAAATSIRTALGISAVALLLSSALLPWRAHDERER